MAFETKKSASFMKKIGAEILLSGFFRPLFGSRAIHIMDP